MRVLFSTYPWAFETPGGGEIQLRKYAEHLPAYGVEAQLHDIWRANLADASLVHFFSCIGGSVHFCNYVRQRGLPLVISSSLWIRPETAHLYPIDEIRSQLALADVVVTNSDAESHSLAEVLDLPRDRFMTVMNGFDPRFAEPQDPIGISEGVWDRRAVHSQHRQYRAAQEPVGAGAGAPRPSAAPGAPGTQAGRSLFSGGSGGRGIAGPPCRRPRSCRPPSRLGAAGLLGLCAAFDAGNARTGRAGGCCGGRPRGDHLGGIDAGIFRTPCRICRPSRPRRYQTRCRAGAVATLRRLHGGHRS